MHHRMCVPLYAVNDVKNEREEYPLLVELHKWGWFTAFSRMDVHEIVKGLWCDDAIASA